MFESTLASPKTESQVDMKLKHTSLLMHLSRNIRREGHIYLLFNSSSSTLNSCLVLPITRKDLPAYFACYTKCNCDICLGKEARKAYDTWADKLPLAWCWRPCIGRQPRMGVVLVTLHGQTTLHGCGAGDLAWVWCW